MSGTLIILLGPTGVGKTELSLRLAEKYGAPILSADSRQVYRKLKIGTAAPDSKQLARAVHYFVGTLELTEYYSAARYEEEAMALLNRLFGSHPVVIMTGGSMLYIDAVCRGIDELPTVHPEIRQELKERFQQEGLESLRRELRLLDPVYYKQADLKNPRRIIHALEICRMTGRPYSSLRTAPRKERPFRILKIGLCREREELYHRINRRVDEMMKNGLLKEARALYPYRTCNSLNTVGYKELFAYFDGFCTLEEAIEKIKQHTRIYSRKQMTWFKKDDEIAWFHPDNEKEIKKFLCDRLNP